MVTQTKPRGGPLLTEKPKGDPWKDFFAALDMYDPAFPIERHQPEQQVRKSLEELCPPRRKRPTRKK